MTLQTIETGLELGSRFLSKETAYFLGMLLADEQIEFQNDIYWQASVRHNPTHFTQQQLEDHLIFIKRIARSLGKESVTHLTDFYKDQGVPIMKFNAGKKGIVTLFKQTAAIYSIDDFIQDITVPLLNSGEDVQRAFLVGVFDGRGSYDKTAKFIVVDYDGENTEGLMRRVLNNLRIETNLNSLASARVRRGSTSAARKKQIRIKHERFLRNIGFISPARYQKAIVDISPEYRTCETPNILSGLKGIEQV